MCFYRLYSLHNLKTKLDDLDADKLETVPLDLKNLSDGVHKQVVKNTKFNTLKSKVNKLDLKLTDATTLSAKLNTTHKNRIWEKALKMSINKYLILVATDCFCS